MTAMAVFEKGPQKKESGWLMTCRIALVIGVGELAASVISTHTNWAYSGGLLLGWALELLIFPRLSQKRNVTVLLIVIVAGLLRVAIKFASP